MAYLKIGFSTPKKWNILSGLIRKLEKTEFSHVYMKFKSESLNRELIYQASGLQVNFVGSSLFSDKHKTIEEFVVQLEETDKKLLLTTCVDNAGMPYSMKQLLGLAIVQIFSFFGKKISNPFKNGRRAYICSELVGYILVKYFNYKIEDLDSVTPKDLYLLMKQHGTTSKT